MHISNYINNYRRHSSVTQWYGVGSFRLGYLSATKVYNLMLLVLRDIWMASYDQSVTNMEYWFCSNAVNPSGEWNMHYSCSGSIWWMEYTLSY